MTYPPQGQYPPPQGYPQQPYPPQQPTYPPPGAPQQQYPPPSNPGGFPQQPYPQSDPGGFPQQPYQQPDPGGFQQYPQQGGFPPPNQPPPNLPPPVPKKGGNRKIIGGVVALGVVGLIIFGIINWGTSASSADAGDCIKVVSASSADAEKTDCSSQEAIYKVAKKLDSSASQCPKGDYTEWTRRSRRSSTKLCLMLNAKEGDCFKVASGRGSNQADERVACDSSAFRVTKVVTGTADESACGKTKNGMAAVYSEPATTLCLSKS